MSLKKNTGYRSALGATALIGGSAFVALFCGLIRGKVVAVWLGPGGVGLLGAYQSIVELFVMIFSIGIGSSGVRVIAEVAGRGDAALAQVAWVIRRLAWVLGLLGAVVLIVLSKRISLWTFGHVGEARPLALLGVAVLAGALALGRNTIIQGMRRMDQLASIGVWGSLLGVAVGVPVVIRLGVPGVVWLPLVAALSNAMLAVIAFRRLRLPPVSRQEVVVMPILSPLMSIGFLFTVNSIANSLLGWIIRTYVIRTSGLDMAGHFQVALNLSNIYVGIVLQAMSADYFPRMASIDKGASKDVSQSINEQLVSTVLLATPGIVATLVMAPVMVEVFYAHSFIPAVTVLRWYLFGALVRVITWPLSMAIYARGTSRWILLADGAFYVVNLLLLVPACKRFGLAGVGSAFFFASCVNFGVAYWVSRRVCSFQFMGLSKRCVAMSVALVGASLLCMTLLPSGFNLLLGGLVAILAALHSLYTFAAIVPGGRLEAIARLAGFNLYGTVKSGIRRHLKNGKGPNV